MNHYYFICYQLLAFLSVRRVCVYALRFYLEEEEEKKTSGKTYTFSIATERTFKWAKRNASWSELSMCARNMHRRIHVGIFFFKSSRGTAQKRDEQNMYMFDLHMRYETRLAYRFI